MLSTLKELRESRKVTQKQAAEIAGVSLRTYATYENDPAKASTRQYRFILQDLSDALRIDEEHGLLTVDEITSCCSRVFTDYKIDFCYLFGSYAKGKATAKSDVDLLVATEETGLKFYGIAEQLREELHKKVDLLDFRQLKENPDLTYEIMKDGIKIYG